MPPRSLPPRPGTLPAARPGLTGALCRRGLAWSGVAAAASAGGHTVRPSSAAASRSRPGSAGSGAGRLWGAAGGRCLPGRRGQPPASPAPPCCAPSLPPGAARRKISEFGGRGFRWDLSERCSRRGPARRAGAARGPALPPARNRNGGSAGAFPSSCPPSFVLALRPKTNGSSFSRLGFAYLPRVCPRRAPLPPSR